MFWILLACSPLRPPPDPVVKLTLAVHLEAIPVLTEEQAFRDQADELRRYGDQFSAHGAVLTLDAKDLIGGMTRWDDPVLLELQDQGHAIGIHADVGGQLDTTQAELEADLIRLREALAKQGVDAVHVSGVCSHLDWVSGAQAAGFSAVTDTVEYCLKSLDAPPAYIQDCETPSACHHPFPGRVAEQIDPWLAEDGGTWLEPANEGLMILPAAGNLSCLDEQLSGDRPQGACVFDEADLEAFRYLLNASYAHAQPGRLNHLGIVWSYGQLLNRGLLAEWLSEIDHHVAEGNVVWTSVPELVEGAAQEP